MPRLVKFKDQSTITYTYAADGTKLRVEHKIGNSTTRTTYCSNVIYEDGTAKCLLTEEGYVSLDDREYHYYLKDHQGNNRVLVNKNGGVEEINHYYPFGGVFASEENVQPYKYNGKELDTKKGLNWYDYGARRYDAALGRWNMMDPSSEKYYEVSSYAYCNNNPVKNIDLDGRDWYIHHETGELYFNSSMNQKEIEYNNRSYARIGGNDMLGDMKDIVEQAYNFEESSSLANANGYSINPVQEIQSEISREQSYSAGKHENTIITGEIVIVNEQYDIFSIDKSRKKNLKTDPLFDLKPAISSSIGNAVIKGKDTNYIERNYFTYTKPTFWEKVGNAIGTINNSMQKMEGTHDYRNVTVFKNWNDYSKTTGKKIRMLKYKK